MAKDDKKTGLFRAGACMLIASVFLFIAAMADVAADMPAAAQPTPADGALKAIVIELFFLFVGLLVVAALGFLIWRARRKKRIIDKKL